MSIHVYQATNKEYRVIQKIAHETWPVTFGKILSKEQIDYMLEMMYSIKSLSEQVEQKGHHFLMARDDQQDVGYASYELYYKGLPKTKIHKIYVTPSAQGKGVGKVLMTEIMKVARENSNAYLSLNVNRDNTSVEFYKKIGFKKIGEEDIDIGNGFLMEDAIMEKSVPLE